MPEIDQETLAALQESFQEITVRAQRLREWMELELYMRQLLNSFSPLYDRVRRTLGPHATSQQPDYAMLSDDWDRCRRTSLSQLQTFATGIQFINQPLVGAAPGNPENSVTTWVATLMEVGEGIQELLIQMGGKPIFDKCRAFDDAMADGVNRHRRQIQVEVNQLCDLTALLRGKL